MVTGDTEGAVLHLDCAVGSMKVHIIKQQNHTGTLVPVLVSRCWYCSVVMQDVTTGADG